MSNHKQQHKMGNGRWKIGIILAGLAVVVLVGVGLNRPAVAEKGGGLEHPQAILDRPTSAPSAGELAAGLQRHQVLATIPLGLGIGDGPNAALYNPMTDLVYIANARSDDLSIL